MIRSAKQVLSIFRRQAPPSSIKNFTKAYPATLGASLLVHMPAFNFAKVSKKKEEKQVHEAERKEANLPKSIDLNIIEDKMKKEMETFKAEIAKIKAGRLTPHFFESFKITAYGAKSNLSELVQFVPKNANTMVLNVFDDSVAGEIHKILENSDKNLQVKRDGKVITCVLQGGSTREMKDGLVKQVKQQVDKAKDKVRDLRSEGIDMVKKFEKFTSKDLVIQANKEVQEIHDKYVAELEKLYKAKDKEIHSS